MADAFKMAVTLPPFLYDSSQKELLPKVISATYTPKEYAEAVSVKAQHNQMLEKVNRAVMGGNQQHINAAIAAAHDTVTAYHQKNVANMPKDTAQPIPGRGVNSLKMATEKLMRNE
jgi:hypothetical protein